MRFQSIILLILAGALMPAVLCAQWSTVTLSQARHHAFPLVVGHKVLFIGGEASGGGSNVVDIYDDSTGTWSVHLLDNGTLNLSGRNPSVSIGSKAIVATSGPLNLYDARTDEWTPVPGVSARAYMSGGVVGQYAVFAGGSSPEGVSDAVDIYNAATGVWSKATLSEPRILTAVAGIGNLVFIAGGIKANNAKSDRVDIWNTETGTWTTAALSFPRGMITALTAGDKVVFASGSEFDYVWYNQVDVYDYSTGVWSDDTLKQYNFAGMLKGRVVDGKAYFGDGTSQPNSSNPSNILDVYDPSANSWSKASLPASHVLYNLTSRGPNIFVAGGVNAPGDARVDMYNTQTGSWKRVGTLAQPRHYMAAASVGNKVLFAGGLQISAGNTDRVDIYTDPSWTGAFSAPAATNLDLYPNPATGRVTLLAPAPALRIVLTDSRGRVLSEWRDNPPGQLTVDLSARPAGVYLVLVETATMRYVGKVVRNAD